MNLYRVTYSGEAYVLAETAGDAIGTMSRRVDDDETGVYVDGATEVRSLQDVPRDWRDAPPFRARGVPDDSRTVEEILK